MKKFIAEIEGILKQHSEKIAYVSGNDSITYGNLNERASRLGNALKRQGSEPVIIYGKKSVDMLVSIVACIISRRAYVPVDADIPNERIKRIIADSGAGLIIANEKTNIPNALSIDEITEKYSCGEIKENSNTVAYIIFTSGSTGDPKGVPISYKNLENFIRWINTLAPLRDGKINTVLNQASFCFDLSVADIYYSLSNGCTLIALSKENQSNHAEMFEIIEKNKAELVVATPSFIKLLMLDEFFCENNIPGLKCFYFCGERLEASTTKKLKSRFPEADIINAYGPTEATSAVCACVIDDKMLENEILPVGCVSSSACDIKITDGEIVLCGDSVFGGYIGGIKGGYYTENGKNCYKTGDIGYIEKGMLYCKGRLDSQIKYSGYRIELSDIENNLLNLDGIENAAVIARYKDDGVTVRMIKAFVTVNNGIGSEEIKKRLSEIIPAYMIPKTVTVLSEMPLNKNGKTDRKRLSEL